MVLFLKKAPPADETARTQNGFIFSAVSVVFPWVSVDGAGHRVALRGHPVVSQRCRVALPPPDVVSPLRAVVLNPRSVVSPTVSVGSGDHQVVLSAVSAVLRGTGSFSGGTGSFCRGTRSFLLGDASVSQTSPQKCLMKHFIG